MGTDVAKCSSPQQRIADRVQEDVGIRVSEEPTGAGNPYAAEHEWPSLSERMNIVTYSHAGQGLFCVSGLQSL
jgi:hypothetical protein